MKMPKLKTALFLSIGLIFPKFSFACLSSIEASETNLIFNSITLWLAVAVGIVATASIFWDAKQFKGGVLEKVYRYFGVGMFLILTGLVVLIVKPWDYDFVFMRLHDILYILGFLVIIIGAKKIVKVYKK